MDNSGRADEIIREHEARTARLRSALHITAGGVILLAAVGFTAAVVAILVGP